jgi:hypothetical protein
MNESMGSDFARNSHELFREFEELCAMLLEAEGYKRAAPQSRPSPNLPIDTPDLVLFNESSGKSAVAEIKLYRSTAVSMSLLRNSIRQLDVYRQQFGTTEAILLLSVPLEPRRIREARLESGIAIFDLKKLMSIAKRDALLGDLLADFIRRASIGVLGSGARALRTADSVPLGSDEQTKQPEGAALAQDLETCPEGQPGAASFERACAAALRYLFREEFAMWKPQNAVEAGFHRIDLLARLAPRHQFWLGIARDFRTRYVVFEFKNYSSPIPQNQIYTTEKYLYPAALRSVAVMVAREGIDEGARHALKGALREAGKLILWVTRSELAAMLRDKDAGNDPHNLLFDRLDELLVDLGR